MTSDFNIRWCHLFWCHFILSLKKAVKIELLITRFNFCTWTTCISGSAKRNCNSPHQNLNQNHVSCRICFYHSPVDWQLCWNWKDRIAVPLLRRMEKLHLPTSETRWNVRKYTEYTLILVKKARSDRNVLNKTFRIWNSEVCFVLYCNRYMLLTMTMTCFTCSWFPLLYFLIYFNSLFYLFWHFNDHLANNVLHVFLMLK